MANSLMQIISDGSLSTIPLTIKFLEQSHIKVFVNNVELPDGTYTFAWSGATTITITPAVALGVEVSIRRKTPADAMLHDFQAGAVFSETSVDENFQQELFLLQEASEQSFVTDLFADLDIHGNSIHNLNTAQLPSDAVNLAQATQIAEQGGSFTLRQDLLNNNGAKLVGGAALYCARVATCITVPWAVGDVVHLGGYHNVMDNSHHTRVIAYSDDGTGVQLTNGLWANILHDGVVDFSWSGALPSDADVSTKVQQFVDAFACKAEVVVKHLYTLSAKVRMKQGAVWRGPNKINGLNVGGLGAAATPPTQQNGFILNAISGWAFDSSIYKLVGGSWVRQDDFIGKAGDIYDGTTYRAVSNLHFRDLVFISADVLDPLENPALETFGAVNFNGSNGSTFKGCRVAGTVLGVCVSGSWGHEVSGNLMQCKLAEYVSYWCSWTKAADNYCSSFNWTLDWTTRFAQYTAKLPIEMTQVRGFAAGQSPFGRTITNMITINSATVFEDNFTERGILGYGVQDEDTHWTPTFRGARGEFHTVLYAARTGSALRFSFDFVANVNHLMELFQTSDCINEVSGAVNRPNSYGNVFNYLLGPAHPFLILNGLDKGLLDATSASKVMRSSYIDGQNIDRVHGTQFWNSSGNECGIAPLSATNGVPLRSFGSAGCVPIKLTVGGALCYGVEVFAGTEIAANGVTGTMRMFYLRSDNTLRIQGWDSSGVVKNAVIPMT
ncbi:tail fiber protein [Aeromonas phage vB_AspA_Bolek]|nr:tail fiber protein [Aeromonas phage vB_AspA_Bolek]